MTDNGKVIELIYNSNGGYLHARITVNNIDRVTALDHLTEIAVTLGETKWKRILIERDAANAVDEELFGAIGEYVRLSPGIKVAFVHRDLSAEDAAKYLKPPASKRAAEFRSFNDLNAAETWLTGPIE